MLHRYLRSRRQ